MKLVSHPTMTMPSAICYSANNGSSNQPVSIPHFVPGVWPAESLEGPSAVRGSSVDYAAALLLAAMAAVLLAAVGYQCAATWRWIMGRWVLGMEKKILFQVYFWTVKRMILVAQLQKFTTMDKNLTVNIRAGIWNGVTKMEGRSYGNCREWL